MSVILNETNNQIVSRLNRIIYNKVAREFRNPRNINFIENAVRNLVIRYIRASETWQSLHGNDDDELQLDANFGIPSESRDAQLDRLLAIWAQEIKVVPHEISKSQTFKFSYDFYAIKADWANVLASDDGVTHNISTRSEKGETPKLIPWMRYLLIDGDVFQGFKIRFGNYSRKDSRSEKAIMVKFDGGEWRTPLKHSGNTDDNFVTRALAKIVGDNDFENQLTDVIKLVGSFGTAKIARIRSIQEELDAF